MLRCVVWSLLDFRLRVKVQNAEELGNSFFCKHTPYQESTSKNLKKLHENRTDAVAERVIVAKKIKVCCELLQQVDPNQMEMT